MSKKINKGATDPRTDTDDDEPTRATPTGMARVRAANPLLTAYCVLNRDVTGDGFEIDLSTLTETQRRDLLADVCVVVEPIQD